MNFDKTLLCSNSQNLSNKFHNTTLPSLYKLCLSLANFPVPSNHACQIISLPVNISVQRTNAAKNPYINRLDGKKLEIVFQLLKRLQTLTL